MTDGIRSAVQDMTGHFVSGCPWRAFSAPIVREVMQAIQFFESGNLAFANPEPSHRLVEGIAFWNSGYNRMYSRQLEVERAERERERQTTQQQPRGRRRRGS